MDDANEYFALFAWSSNNCSRSLSFSVLISSSFLVTTFSGLILRLTATRPAGLRCFGCTNTGAGVTGTGAGVFVACTTGNGGNVKAGCWGALTKLVSLPGDPGKRIVWVLPSCCKLSTTTGTPLRCCLAILSRIACATDSRNVLEKSSDVGDPD